MISTLLVSLVAVGMFAIGLHLTGVGKAAHNVYRHTFQGIAAMTNTELTDDDKEQIVRHAGASVIFGAWSILWRFTACIVAALIPIYFADTTRLANGRDILGLMLRPDYIVVVSVALISVIWLMKKVGYLSNTVEQISHYSMGERLVHMIAFSSPNIQKVAARVDDVVFNLFNREAQNFSPIFITSLARGGTTALLNAFSTLPFVATHTYRDMPFVTAPYLWSRLSAPLRRKVMSRERAHGDGLEIDLDSPEAFEEVYWLLYWPEKYHKRSIDVWRASDINAEGISRLQACFKKIATIRGRPGAHYLSKNNANIARLRLIFNIFPDANVVVPVRRPAPHAASLLRQHRNFLELQSKDDFVRRYMRDIGHLEFGVLHTPLALDDFSCAAYDLNSPDYWLSYWIAAFREVLDNIDYCYIVLQDDLRSNTNSCMRHLLGNFGFNNDERDFTSYFHNFPDETDTSIFSPGLLKVAESLYGEISEKAIR